jgi:hypothetical protein
MWCNGGWKLEGSVSNRVSRTFNSGRLFILYISRTVGYRSGRRHPERGAVYWSGNIRKLYGAISVSLPILPCIYDDSADGRSTGLCELYSSLDSSSLSLFRQNSSLFSSVRQSKKSRQSAAVLTKLKHSFVVSGTGWMRGELCDCRRLVARVAAAVNGSSRLEIPTASSRATDRGLHRIGRRRTFRTHWWWWWLMLDGRGRWLVGG